TQVPGGGGPDRRRRHRGTEAPGDDALTVPLRIGIAGLGTVGAGALRLLAENRALLARRSGRDLLVSALSARDRTKDRGVPVHDIAWHEDARALAVAPDVDVVVELIGGADG